MKQKFEAGFMLELNLPPELEQIQQQVAATPLNFQMPPTNILPANFGTEQEARTFYTQNMSAQNISAQNQAQMGILPRSVLERVCLWVASRWPHCELVEAFQTRLLFRIPKGDVPSLAKAFTILEAGIFFLY